MSDDLVAFIEARMRAEEAEALAATPGPWRYNPDKMWNLPGLHFAEEFIGAGPLDTPICVAATGPADHPQSMADARFIARHDPARVLRDIAAKRKAVTTHRWHGPDGCEEDRFCPLLTAMASVWSDHPGFQPEWLIEENG